MVRMKIPGSVYRRSIGKWVAQTPEVYDPDRRMWRRVSLGTFSTKDQAEMELRRFNEKLGRSKALSTAEIRSMRVDRHLDDWLESVIEQGRTGDLAARTVSGYESAVRLHINPVLGRRTIADLDERVVVNWLGNLRRKGLADRTVLRIFRTAQRAFGDAPLDHNPFNLPKRMRPRVRQERRTYRPSLEEVTTFLGHVSACDQSIFLSVLWRPAATTGMRRGELVGVEWTDVDLDAGRLSISRSIVMDGSRLIVKPPKSQIASSVRRAKDRTRKSWRWLAKRLGISHSHLLQISQGVRCPSKSVALAMKPLFVDEGEWALVDAAVVGRGRDRLS